MAVTFPNQWSGTFAQSASFTTTAPALESVVVALTPANSVGGGSGTPSAGNWLVCITGMNESATTAGFTVGVADDIHSYWRPAKVSTGTALTRTSLWYTPNTSLAAGNVYVAPNGAFDALSVLIVEVAGAGPWDTLTGTASNYSAAATTLNLALGAPGASSFVIAAVCGDDSTHGQAFAPGGWTALHTVTATNGTDHTADAVLTSAALPSNSSSLSVNGTASSGTDLSGVICSFQISAASPVPAGNNPNWPYLKFEAAFGGGFQDPQDTLTWTDLSARLWSWDETTGIQYQLGNVQATDLEMELDNFDGHLSSDNASGPYYPDIVTGTPLRIRAALGTIGGVTVNRWYVIQRNLQEWPQQVDPAYRRYIAGTATDIWSVMASSGPSPYRGEVYQDSPYAWWPMDDQPLTGGVLPTSLRNAAPGNTNVLNITPAGSGVSSTDTYSTTGRDLTADASNCSPLAPPSVATSAVGQQAGWLFGDPQSSPASYQTSNPVTANPGSAAWQQAGLLGNTGTQTWCLTCNDASFPVLAGGVTVKGWFNAGFFGSAAGCNVTGVNQFNFAAQPATTMTICTLGTGSAPVFVLELDSSGHLIAITYNGTTPTNHTVYSSSDLRSGAWTAVDVTLTTTTWAVYVNGSLTASASGSVSAMTSAWTWLTLNADYGSTHGGSSPSSITHGGNIAFAHWAVFSAVLPKWRILAHYCAGITGFGLLPAPTAITALQVANLDGRGTYTPDGSEFNGSYGTGGSAYTFSGLVAAQAGSFTSGPSARAVIAGQGISGGSPYSNAVWVGFTAVAPSVLIYSNASADAETNASTVCGSGGSFTSGFGAGASGHGVCHTAGGSGASPPSSASALGDTVAQRLERILGYAGAAVARCIDPAALAVQAATDIGGQQAGQNLSNIAQSDGGLLYVDNLGNLTYWQKSHLAAQYSSPVWTLTPTAPPTPGAPATAIPYYREGFRWLADPQRVWNAITIQPFSPDGASLADITPSDATTADASQRQYGAQPHQVTSYLQSTTEMQNQADWLLTNFGQEQIRAEGVKIDAAPYPAAWPLVLGISVGDVVTCANWQIGGGGIVGTFRVSNIKRRIVFGDDREPTEASVTLQLDFEPNSYWT